MFLLSNFTGRLYTKEGVHIRGGKFFGGGKTQYKLTQLNKNTHNITPPSHSHLR